MANELTKTQACLPGEPIHQQAEKIVNVGHADTVQTNNTFFFTTGLPGMPGYAPIPTSFSMDRYNLIVYGQEPFTTDCHITFEKRRCLVERDNISDELRQLYSPLTPEAMTDLKSFLCLLLSENRHSGWTDEDHYGCVAQLVDIKNRTNGIELYLHPLFAVPQARISELIHDLGICGKYKRFNELNHSHWTVKEIDLMEVLNDAGLNPLQR